MIELSNTPLWGQRQVELMRLIAPLIRTEGGDVNVIATQDTESKLYRVLVTGKNAPELHRRVAIVIEEEKRGES